MIQENVLLPKALFPDISCPFVWHSVQSTTMNDRGMEVDLVMEVCQVCYASVHRYAENCSSGN